MYLNQQTNLDAWKGKINKYYMKVVQIVPSLRMKPSKQLDDKSRLVNSHYINIDPQDQDPLPVTTIALWLIHMQP